MKRRECLKLKGDKEVLCKGEGHFRSGPQREEGPRAGGGSECSESYTECSVIETRVGGQEMLLGRKAEEISELRKGQRFFLYYFSPEWWPEAT